ncbi:MAG: HAD-IIIA family hydrolase [Nitrososphaerales archaeon]|jgi:D-glycero-D-manno-heptose 1,7-bisphosphate phosphatase
MSKNRAVLVDRDGVLNELVYYKDGRVGSPITAKQLVVYHRAAESVEKIQKMGYKAIVISNQPGVGKKQFSYAELQRMNNKIKRALAKKGVSFDGEYYCLHHPRALIKKYRLDCDCKKPKPGLIIKAAEEHDLDLKKSYFVGDSLTDVQAGKAAGCKTVLIGQMTDMLNRMMKKHHAVPDFMIANLSEMDSIL